jgi:hypothetical protein
MQRAGFSEHVDSQSPEDPPPSPVSVGAPLDTLAQLSSRLPPFWNGAPSQSREAFQAILYYTSLCQYFNTYLSILKWMCYADGIVVH